MKKACSFSGPAVRLQVELMQLKVSTEIEAVTCERLPNRAVQAAGQLRASFLNNSSSRWESIVEPWPIHIEGVDQVSIVFRSDRRTYAYLYLLPLLLPALLVQTRNGMP